MKLKSLLKSILMIFLFLVLIVVLLFALAPCYSAPSVAEAPGFCLMFS